MKEVRFGDKIAEHDVNVHFSLSLNSFSSNSLQNKMNTVKKFLLQMIAVKITIVCEGEYDGSLAQAMIDNLYSRVSHFAKRDANITVNNRWVSMILFDLPTYYYYF